MCLVAYLGPDMRSAIWLRPFNALLVVVIAIVITSLWVSNGLVQRLAKEEEGRLKLYVEILKYIVTHEGPESQFLFDNFLKTGRERRLVNVPTIVTDTAGNPLTDNLDLDPELTPDERDRALRRELAAMKADREHPPLVIEFDYGQYNLIYYRESDTLRVLRAYPYIAFGFIALLTLAGFYSVLLSERNQQNRVWAGLAKETAHQLGTPISGLIAWLELLRARHTAPDDEQVLAAMHDDVQHLQNIAERFSKIGSDPELSPTELGPLLERATDYVSSRIARSGRITVRLNNELAPGTRLPLNAILFEWVIENLLKNALDALTDQAGAIFLRARQQRDQVLIEVEDTGRGMARAVQRDIFKPGFTTKKRGWGLGLSLSRRIVENYHRGRIRLVRSEPGRGSLFRVELPMGD